MICNKLKPTTLRNNNEQSLHAILFFPVYQTIDMKLINQYLLRRKVFILYIY